MIALIFLNRQDAKVAKKNLNKCVSQRGYLSAMYVQLLR